MLWLACDKCSRGRTLAVVEAVWRSQLLSEELTHIGGVAEALLASSASCKNFQHHTAVMGKGEVTGHMQNLPIS